MLKNDTIVGKLLWVLLLLGGMGGVVFLYISETSPLEYNKTTPQTPPQSALPPQPRPNHAREETTLNARDADREHTETQQTHQSAFVKKTTRIRCVPNCLTALLKSSINPVLIAQLTSLNQRLSALQSGELHLLYADYEQNQIVNPINSKIIAAVNGNFQFFAREAHGSTLFYDKHGNAPEPAMNRYPLTYERISSPFDLHRVHPITRQVRPHYGVDFAAPVGREIFAAGDGVVVFAGSQTGYGKLLIIEHAYGYETRYAHLHRYFVQEGDSVKRGQKIALVGNTGFATGPHLHYEVRIDGVAYDPLTVQLPSQFPLPPDERQTWQFRAEQNLDTLTRLQSR